MIGNSRKMSFILIEVNPQIQGSWSATLIFLQESSRIKKDQVLGQPFRKIVLLHSKKLTNENALDKIGSLVSFG